MRVFRQALGVAFLGGVMLVSVVSVSSATEVEPLTVTKFAMQTTAPTDIVPLGHSATTQAERYEFINERSAFTQAGGHPWALTTTIEFATEETEVTENQRRQGFQPKLVPTRDPKDIVVDLPPGLLGDPLATPRCPLTDIDDCPVSTQIGEWRVRWHGGDELIAPIFNVVPEAGQSAEFTLGTEIEDNPVLTAHLVRTAQGYGFTVASNRIPEVELSRAELTFWGVPADPSHDAMRGLICRSQNEGESLTCNREAGGTSKGVPAGVAEIPFLTMPTSCAEGPVTGTVRADSWQEPGSVGVNGRYTGFVEAQATLPAATGCATLAFDPSIEVQPNTLAADEPVELGVNVKVPQNEQAGADASPHLRDAVVTLPEGMSISPSVVDGIQACNATGPEGINMTGPESEEVGLNGELQLAPGHCPDASTVGTAEAITPLLPEPIKGHVYLARPGCGGAGQPPCSEADALDGNLYQLYLELGGKGPLANTGIEIKVAGYTEANPATGQLTTKFLEDPQAPFSELKIDLNGGPRAPLDNPATCGAATTTADFTPWSAPGLTPEGLSVAGTADATWSSFYNVDLAGDGLGTPCPSLPFSPGFSAGTVSSQAGAYSSFTMNLSRQDREQYIKGIQVHTPPGLLGMLSSVALCEEPAADNGHCPESSKIGTTRVASGAGSHPFEIEGNVYLTKGYDGAPFGLSIATNAVAGPFNLGLVVVRARIAVNPEDSTLTITTDETGPYAVPQIIFGVPLRLQRVTVDIDRPGFMFNPTNCDAQQITATISGTQGALANLASPFAAGGCKSLAFKPSFTVSTSGKTSRADGASLDAKVVYPMSAPGSEANIKSVKVDLPKQLPSRLTTLQKACAAATFEGDPASCPAASVIGIARASTPLLPAQLTGPVYFVSHGGEAFPSLVIVLQGDGVRVDLTAATFISKRGITSSTFKSVPDVPVSTFELYLPEGRYSALAANGNLCKSKLAMPTVFVAQNGAEIHRNTMIAVTGCSKATQEGRKPKTQRKAKQKIDGRTSR